MMDYIQGIIGWLLIIGFLMTIGGCKTSTTSIEITGDKTSAGEEIIIEHDKDVYPRNYEHVGGEIYRLKVPGGYIVSDNAGMVFIQTDENGWELRPKQPTKNE